MFWQLIWQPKINLIDNGQKMYCKKIFSIKRGLVERGVANGHVRQQTNSTMQSNHSILFQWFDQLLTRILCKMHINDNIPTFGVYDNPTTPPFIAVTVLARSSQIYGHCSERDSWEEIVAPSSVNVALLAQINNSNNGEAEWTVESLFSNAGCTLANGWSSV